MAMTSLFGPTPAEIQAAQRQQSRQEIAQEAQPFGVFAPLYAASRNLGRTAGQSLVSGLFPEAQDPALREAQAVEQIRQKYMGQNMTDPKVLQQMAVELGPVAPMAALRLAQTAKQLTPSDETIALAPGGTLVNRRTGDVIAQAPDRESMVKTPADFALTGQSLGIAPKANAADYTAEETQLIQAKILENKVAQARASATTINTADPGWQVKAVGEVNSQTKENDTQLTYISQALNTTLNGRTPFDQKAFETLVGNVFGGKVKAQAEIERLRNSGTLGQRLDNTLGLFLQGKIGEASRDNQAEVLLSLYELSGKQRDVIVDQYRGILGPDSSKVTRTTAERHPLPKLTGNREYIPMSVVNQYNLSKGQKVKQGNKEFVYNGDGTITVLKKGE